MFGTYSEVTIDQNKQQQQQQNSKSHHFPNNSTSDERLTKSQNTDQLSSIRNFHKSHRRMRSHENVSMFRSFDSSSSGRHLSAGSSRTTLSDKPINQQSVEDDVFLSRNGGGVGVAAGGTNDTMADIIRRANEVVSDELPEGWQEVQDGAETYFWHIWTGTIQHERPSLTAVRILSYNLWLVGSRRIDPG